MRTPWGMSDSRKQIFEEIYHHGTPSHGGLFVPVEYHQHLTKESVALFSSNKSQYKRDGLWFEEDCAYKLPLLEIKASLGKLSIDDLKKSIGGALYWGGLSNLNLDHPLYRMINENINEPEIREAVKKAKARLEEQELSDSPGGIRCRMLATRIDELLRETKMIHGGEAKDLKDLEVHFESKGMREEWKRISELFEAKKLVFTGTVAGDLYVEEFGGKKHIHVDQYEKGRITLIVKN